LLLLLLLLRWKWWWLFAAPRSLFRPHPRFFFALVVAGSDADQSSDSAAGQELLFNDNLKEEDGREETGERRQRRYAPVQLRARDMETFKR
jgi:hypothetical protein